MSYSSDEIQAAVQKVALTRIRRNIGSLGEKQIAQTFNDVQEAALGIFLLYQTAPFYVAYLAALRLLEVVQTQVSNVLQFQQALLNAGRRVLPVDNVTPLANATAALFELQGAVDARGAVFNAIEKTPAFQRFSSNVDTFLAQNGPAIKSNGNVAQTPQEAKQSLRLLLSSILETQVILQDNAQFLANAMTDYSGLNLPAVAAQGTVSRASQAVARLSALLSPLTPIDRLEHLRLGILDLLTARAVIREVASFKVPAPIFVTEGDAVAFADDDHPAVPATVVADIFAPYRIQGSPSMSIALDGAPATAIPLPNSLYASLNGGMLEPFNFTDLTGMSITGSVADPFTIALGLNDLLVLYVFDTVVNVSTQVFCILTPGVAQTAANVASDINAALTGVALATQYEAVAGGAGNQHIVLRSKVGNKGSLVRMTVGQGTANATLGLPAGTTAAGTDSNLHFIVAPNGAPAPMDFAAGSTSAASAAAQINGALGPNIEAVAEGQLGFQYVTIRYVGASPFAATLLLPSSNNPAAGVLGMVTGATAYARTSSARDVARLIAQALPAVVASSEVVPIANGANLLLRTDVTDPSLAVIYKVRGSCSVLPGIGNTLTLTDPAGGFLAKGVLVGDYVVFRDGVNLNTMWAITGVTDQTITASGLAPAAAGAAEYEVGPNLPIVVGDVLQVPTGPQNGTYSIVAVGPRTLSVPFELELQSSLPGFQSPSFGPRFFVGSVGEERLRLASRSTGPSSSIAVTGPGASTFFLAGSAAATGTTPWVRLPAAVPSLAAGDVLEDYQAAYNAPTDTFPLQSVNGTVVGIQPAAVSLGRVFSLTPDSLVPFAVLRSSAYEAFAAMSNELFAWTSLPVNQPPFMRELQRLVNIVLFEGAPSPDQVSAAFQQAEVLADALVNTSSPAGTLAHALEGFVVQPVDQIDALIRSYSEKGAQRAIDILLQGRFSSFFGLDIDGLSYAGALLSQMRTVARTDLVVRKIDRKASTTSAVQSSSESPDYEYDVSNIEQVPLADVPNEFERVPSTRGDPANS